MALPTQAVLPELMGVDRADAGAVVSGVRAVPRFSWPSLLMREQEEGAGPAGCLEEVPPGLSAPEWPQVSGDPAFCESLPNLDLSSLGSIAGSPPRLYLSLYPGIRDPVV